MKAGFFRNLEFKKNIISPIITNLITALVLFLSVVIFKEPIYRSLGLIAEDFPIYCLSEPYNRFETMVSADFFIINLEDYEITEKKLRAALKKAGSEEIKPYIRIRWDQSIGNITNIQEDTAFNKGKGKIIAKREGNNGDWIIKVQEIKGKAIMKFVISTDYKRPISRSAVASIPFKVIYPGK